MQLTGLEKIDVYFCFTMLVPLLGAAILVKLLWHNQKGKKDEPTEYDTSEGL